MKNIFILLSVVMLGVGCNADVDPAGLPMEVENAVLVDTVAVDSVEVEPAAEALPEVQD